MLCYEYIACEQSDLACIFIRKKRTKNARHSFLINNSYTVISIWHAQNDSYMNTIWYLYEPIRATNPTGSYEGRHRSHKTLSYAYHIHRPCLIWYTYDTHMIHIWSLYDSQVLICHIACGPPTHPPYTTAIALHIHKAPSILFVWVLQPYNVYDIDMIYLYMINNELYMLCIWFFLNDCYEYIWYKFF